MKIAVSANSPDLDTDIDPRFGRCQYLILVDPETMNFEAIKNSGGMGSGGAGIATAQLIAGKGVEAVLTGNCGPNAYQVLSAALAIQIRWLHPAAAPHQLPGFHIKSLLQPAMF